MSFGTILTIFGVLTNFWTLALFLGLLAFSAAMYFIPPPLGGLPKLIKFWTSLSTYMAIAMVLGVIYIGNATKTIEKQKEVIHQDAVQKDSTGDGLAVLIDNVKIKKADEPVKTRLRHAIDTAKPGDEEDAFLDQLAREQCSDPANHARPDCLHK